MIGLGFIFDLPLPLLTVQILWINMVTDSLPALALAFESPSEHVLKQSPRTASKVSMRKMLLYAIYLSIVGFTVGLFLYLWGLGHSVDKARTLVFNFAVFVELAYVLSIRSRHRIWQSVKTFLENKYLLVSIGLVLVLQFLTFTKPGKEIFSTTSLRAYDAAVLAVAVLVSFVFAEVIRALMDRKKND